MTVVKSCYYRGHFLAMKLFIHFCCKMCRLGSMHSVRDRRTDGRTDGQHYHGNGDQYDPLTKMTKTNKKTYFYRVGLSKNLSDLFCKMSLTYQRATSLQCLNSRLAK